MIIGITGYKRSGKDTAASVLVEKYGYERHGFFDAGKDMALAVDPYVDGYEIDGGVGAVRLAELVGNIGWERAKGCDDVRRFLQRLGSEGIRDNLGPDAWILRLRRTLTGASTLSGALKASLNPHRNIVVPDMRFPNEAAAIRELGGCVWKVKRPGFTGDGHQSETGIEQIKADVTFYNDQDVEFLRDAVCDEIEMVRA